MNDNSKAKKSFGAKDEESKNSNTLPKPQVIADGYELIN